jgi:hypothetical protein
MIEHMEFTSHSHGGKDDGHAHNLVSGNHDDLKHQAEIKLYISIFAILRLTVFLTQIYRNDNIQELREYLLTNWFGTIQPPQAIISSQ